MASQWLARKQGKEPRKRRIMEELPLVSIITPSYNQGEFIEETILSIKNQDYPSIEHIIVDGASTDSTLDVIKKYEGTYNMRWVSEPDKGMYEAINKGLGKAQGKILAWLCADDLYLPWTVSVVTDYLNHHQQVGLLYGDMINVNVDTGRNRLFVYAQFNYPYLVRSGFWPSPAVFFRRSVVDKVGLFDENLKLHGDCEYWLRVGKQCKVSKIEEVLAIERNHPKTKRASQRPQLLEEVERVRQRYGAPEGIRRYPPKIVDLLRGFVSRRFSRVKFAFYYWTKRRDSSPRGSLTYPYQSLMEFSGFQVVSWMGFFIMMMPWVNRKYRGNWFVLDMEQQTSS